MRIDLGCSWPQVFGRRAEEATQFGSTPGSPWARSLYDKRVFTPLSERTAFTLEMETLRELLRGKTDPSGAMRYRKLTSGFPDDHSFHSSRIPSPSMRRLGREER
jgi:hypothetical protein